MEGGMDREEGTERAGLRGRDWRGRGKEREGTREGEREKEKEGERERRETDSLKAW